MNPILATDYGNLAVFVFGTPVLLCAMALIVCGFIFRQRWCHIVAGLIALVTGIEFFRSLPEAKINARPITKEFGWGAFAITALAALGAAVTKADPASPRKSAPEQD